MLVRTLPWLCAALLLASSARAEATSTTPLEPESVERAIVFAALDVAPGPRRTDAPAPEAPTLHGQPQGARLDWVSPVFVWIEEGYAFAETTFAF